ncbi:phycobilisome protein [filamentous cyanobacterium CCP5]|nr:phycobilisome protein [filamentous cyanobacterium CCP5]
MLNKLDTLTLSTDGRYATDVELQFFYTYLPTLYLRIRIYQKIQAAEKEIIQQVLKTLTATAPTLLWQNDVDLTAKWQRDTVRVLRYAALAVLTDDLELFQERLLLWFSTIMEAFGVRRNCKATYSIMQAVIKRHLTPQEAALFLPVWQLCYEALGASSQLDTPAGS